MRLKCALFHKSAQTTGLKSYTLTFPRTLRLHYFRPFHCFVLEALMKSSRGLLFAQRLNELNSQLSQLEELRAQIKEAERRASGAPTLRSTPNNPKSREDRYLS